MPNLVQSPARPQPLAPVSPPSQAPATFATIGQTILKLALPDQLPSSSAQLSASDATIAAMQHLITTLAHLRSTMPSTHVARQAQSELDTAAALTPYVSEEAYDVMDALRHHMAAPDMDSAVQPDLPHLLAQSLDGSTAQSPLPLYLSIETLIPYLLWCVARSTYSCMQLIEGSRAQALEPDKGWTDGMLRLVVLLEAETPTVNWCFDLATGYAPTELLSESAILRSDEAVLPLTPSAPLTDHCPPDATYGRVDDQLQQLNQRLQQRSTVLKALLQGIAVDLLQPDMPWQTGTLRLRLGFEFVAQPVDAIPFPTPAHTECVNAELIDDRMPIPPAASPVSGHALLKTRVSVLARPGRSLSPATLVRLTDPDAINTYTQLTQRQQSLAALAQLLPQAAQCNGTPEGLLPIVAAALANCEPLDPHHASLLQPALLMDELVPQFLWAITRSTYEMTQLLGGIPAHVLQPSASWQQGILRLLATLQLEATDIDDRIDISTGRAIPMTATVLTPGTIVQSSVMPLFQQTMPIDDLVTHVWQQILVTMPEISVFRDRVAMEWLEAEQDWQPGMLQCHLSFEFVPN